MRLLVVHNHYQQPAGEDAVFEAEKALFASRRHEVAAFLEDNVRLNGMSLWKTAVDVVWSREVLAKSRRLLQETRPVVARFPNTFLCISSVAYDACRKAGVPVVQTFHNYRLLSPNALLYQEGIEGGC